MALAIDLNSDVGESFGHWQLGCDEAAMGLITSANIACGFHASDPMTMVKTVRLAKANGVAVGAHPGFHDLVGFGRRAVAATPEEIKADVIYQIGALMGVCNSEGVRMRHVKVHGALYNLAEKDISISTAIAEAIGSVGAELIMICLAHSKMVEGAKAAGVKYAEEAFADRAYTSDGTLVPRRQPGAVLQDIGEISDRVWSMVESHTVKSIDGVEIPMNPQTICVHGDTPGAVEMIRAIRKKLEAEGVVLKAFGQ